MEIFDIMENYNRRRERELKEDLSKRFFQAESIAEHVGMYLNSQNKARKLWDFFPELFEDEKKAYEKAVAKEELEKAKENRRAYAQEIKRRRKLGLISGGDRIE